MAYVETDGYELWVDDRPTPNNGDVYKIAAETFARDVERFLYRHTNPGGKPNPAYRNEDFLAWAIARFDACKTGSGQSYRNEDWEPGAATLSPIPPPEQRSNPASYHDNTIGTGKNPSPKRKKGGA